MGTGNKPEGGLLIFYITDGGRRLAEKITKGFPGSEILKYNAGSFARKWASSGNIVCIMATGIVVRTIAPLLKDKRTDPAVVVLDEKGQYVISLVSGHIGGANRLAEKIAAHLGARAVITTASDVQGRVALDVWAKDEGLYVEDFERLKQLSARIVNGKKIKIMIDAPLDRFGLPGEFIQAGSVREAQLVVSCRLYKKEAAYLRPKVLSVGIGCNRGTGKDEIEDVLSGIFERERLSLHSIRNLATIDLKRDEKGLLEFARDKGLDIAYFTKDELNSASAEHDIKGSAAVKAATGAGAVAEPSAILAAEKEFGRASIIIPKQKRGNVTLAIAKAEFML
ncbi:MAG: cobalt-precorrin 5A hydrolase [Nitrospirota bacterium]|nr:cobalt-precorrin 5A hydrolase [Nitrospirota bacterium]